MATPTGDEQVRYDILIEAKAAITAMRDMLKYTKDNTVKIAEFTNQVLQDSKRWGVSWQQALNVYKQLNNELGRQKQGKIFGQTGGQDLMAASEKYLNSLQQAGRLHEEMGQKAETGSKRAVRGIDAVRIATGALIAMLIFGIKEAIVGFFREAINQARQFEETLYRLRNVEQSLSMEGIEVSMKGLKKGIEDIQKILPIFSKEDVSQLVGTLAISTKQLGLNEKQILDLAKAIGILNVRSEKQEDLSTTAQHVLSSLLTGNAKGITALGIAFTDNVMRAKAMELGFIKADESLSELSENEKGITKLNIILESTGQEMANIGDYLDTNSAKLQENKAAWRDLQTTVGQIILPFIPALTEFFSIIRDGFNFGKVIIIEFMTLLGALGVVMAMVFTGRIKDIGTFTKTLKTSIDTFRETLVNRFFLEMPEDAPDWFKSGWGDLIKKEAETATGPVQDLGEAIEELDASGLESKIEDILSDAENAREDIEENLKRKLADLDTEYERKALDAKIDFNRKVEDINRDAERELANLREKQREEDIRDEENYQNKLWELRMRFLMDLEDALHARDARQVLRLIKQYNIDKEALARKKALDDKTREQDQKNQLEDIETKRRQRLEDAKIEYQQRLADQQIAKQRELEDLQKWRERELAEIELGIQRKMETLLKGWVDEQKITEANAAQIYGILSKYFGPGGLTDALYSYMMASMVAHTQGAISSAMSAMTSSMGAFGSLQGSAGTSEGSNSIGASNSLSGPLEPSSPAPSSAFQMHNYAEGGTLLATRPTRALFGEGGPELVNFTPLDRIGKNINKIFGDRSGANGGVDGEIRVSVELSPDLEGRIVEQSMNGVARVISQVQRAK